MRLTSTVESTSNNEVTVLACLETILAIGLYFWIAIVYSTTSHIVVAVCIAPLLLLRTTDSINEAVAIYVKSDDFWSEFIEDNIPISFLGLIIGLPVITIVLAVNLVLPLFIKSYIAIKYFIMSPLNSIKEIPNNYNKIILCTDFHHSLELVPGICERGFLDLSSQSFYSDIKDDDLLIRLWSLFFIPLVFLPAIFYRLSLKATSVIYWPLLWIITSANKVNAPYAIDYLKKEGDFKPVLSWIVLCYYLGMTVIYSRVSAFLSQYSVLDPIVEAMIPNYLSLGSWHTTSIVCAIITIFLHWYTNNLTFKMKHNKSDGKYAPLIISGLTKIRTIFILWTIGCGVYILTNDFNWLSIRFTWLPW